MDINEELEAINVDIDFQEIYDFIRAEEPQFTDLCDIYLEFIDNME